MQLRHKFQHFKKGELPMVDYLQQLHSIYCNLKAVGEPLKDSDLVAHTLLGLPSTFHAFKTVTNAQLVRPSFSDIKPLLLGEEDNVILTQKDHPSPHVVMYSSTSPSERYTNTRNQTVNNQGKNDGLLGAAPNSLLPLKGSTQCQIYQAFNHSALECINRFNHSFTSSNLHKSLAAMHFVDDAGSTWYPDSGALAHITGNPKLLTSLTPFYGSTTVMVGNGNKLPITHTTLHNLQLNNVLLVTALKKNLISIQKLCQDNNCLAEFSSSSLVVKDQETQQSKPSCSSHGSLYPFTTAALQAFSSQVVSAVPLSSDIWHN
ncbi:hypothetical protein LIER_15949 [Lithospermum erythrorhizon]|uniref:Retrovirus-related Pol polyprotein from transposon TNT 1-94-like beta-barrel domain-containing protein n=1 Tax=Lithospermum erythrorhizon TaxID=34254 RepID=A0AAV3Q8X2_LITER